MGSTSVWPVGVDALRGAEAVVGILVVEELVLLAPHILVYIFRQFLYVVLKLLYLLPALQIEAHFQQYVCHHYLLEAGVEPYHVAVAVYGVVAFGHARHVVHARSPSAAPVGAVAPCAVELQPFVVGGEHGEHLVQAVVVAELRVVFPFRPRQQVGSGARRVVAAEAVGAVGAYLTADEAVGMLLGVEVVEGFLEREEVAAIAAEHGYERVVPHEYVAVVGRGDVACDESRVVEWLADVLYSYLPCLPVHFNLLVVTVPIWRGQHLPGLFKCARRGLLHLCRAEGVLGYEGLHDVRVLVGQLVQRRAGRYQVLC